MLDLHDPFVQFGINALITLSGIIIAVFISIYVYRKQRIIKEISYAIISDAPIVSINKKVADKVEMFFNGKPINDARLLVFKIWNSGNVAVRRDDYEEPIRVVFDGQSVVNCDILETEPEDLIDAKDLQKLLATQSDFIEFPKFLLNPRQSLTINILVTGPESKIKCHGRIIDGNIRDVDLEKRKIYANRNELIKEMLDISFGTIPIVGGILSVAVRPILSRVFKDYEDTNPS